MVHMQEDRRVGLNPASKPGFMSRGIKTKYISYHLMSWIFAKVTPKYIFTLAELDIGQIFGGPLQR